MSPGACGSGYHHQPICRNRRLRHAVIHGHRKACLRTVNSDVVVLSVHIFTTLQNWDPSELWIGYGSGKSYTDIQVHDISLQLGHDKQKALLFFHAFTGCDVTSNMLGIGKQSGWNAWMNFPELTDMMISLTENPQELTEDSLHMQRIEKLQYLCTPKTVLLSLQMQHEGTCLLIISDL